MMPLLDPPDYAVELRCREEQYSLTCGQTRPAAARINGFTPPSFAPATGSARSAARWLYTDLSGLSRFRLIGCSVGLRRPFPTVARPEHLHPCAARLGDGEEEAAVLVVEADELGVDVVEDVLALPL